MTVGATFRDEVVVCVQWVFGPAGSDVGWHQSGAETPQCGKVMRGLPVLTESICLVSPPVAAEPSWTGTSFLEVKGVYYQGPQETSSEWEKKKKYMF